MLTRPLFCPHPPPIQLLHCDKDLREVMAICDFLERVLSPACEQVSMPTCAQHPPMKRAAFSIGSFLLTVRVSLIRTLRADVHITAQTVVAVCASATPCTAHLHTFLRETSAF